MDFNSYQQKALSTAIYNSDYCVMYPTLGLVGEAGEVADKVKKIYRDRKGYVTGEDAEALKKELGDVLWYLAVLSDDLGLDLTTVAEANLAKLSSRKARGKLQGSGDDR